MDQKTKPWAFPKAHPENTPRGERNRQEFDTQDTGKRAGDAQQAHATGSPAAGSPAAGSPAAGSPAAGSPASAGKKRARKTAAKTAARGRAHAS